MDALGGTISLFGIAVFFIGLVRPSWAMFWSENPTRWKAGALGLAVIFAGPAVVAIFEPPIQSTPASDATVSQNTGTQQNKPAASAPNRASQAAPESNRQSLLYELFHPQSAPTSNQNRWVEFSGVQPDGTPLKFEIDTSSIKVTSDGVSSKATVRFSDDNLADVTYLCATAARPQSYVSIDNVFGSIQGIEQFQKSLDSSVLGTDDPRNGAGFRVVPTGSASEAVMKRICANSRDQQTLARSPAPRAVAANIPDQCRRMREYVSKIGRDSPRKYTGKRKRSDL